MFLKNKHMRNSNFELLRIITIILIITGHSSFNCIGIPSTWDDCHVLSFFVSSFTVVGVNVFILITGYFSAKLKKRSIFNLLYICLFYALFRIGYDLITSNLSMQTVQSLLFVSSSNWFIPAYLGLLIIAEFINPFIEQASKQQFGKLLLIFFIFQIWFGWRPGLLYGNDFAGGYSILSFVFLYLLGRYYQLYGISLFSTKGRCVILYLSISLLLALWVTGGYYFDKVEIVRLSRWHAYNNPLIIISSLAFFAWFSQINIRPSKTINYLAQSTLGVLLFHVGRPVFPYMQRLFTSLYATGNILTIIVVGGGIILVIYVAGVLFDQLRIFSYKYLSKFLKF